MTVGVAIDRRELKRLRENKGWTMTQLAERMSKNPEDFTITQNSIGKFERGLRRPSPEAFRRLCDALGCDPDELRSD